MKNTILILISILLIVSCKKNEIDPIAEMSAIRGYKDWYIGNFRCGIFVPPSYDRTKKYPLIIFLHGKSDTTTWNLNWYNEPVISEDPCIVLTPKCPLEEIYGWGDSFHDMESPMMIKANEMIEMAEKAFNLDKDRYYIHGTSMGGYGTYGALQKHSDRFAAAYVECGMPNIDIAPIIKDIPIWIFHGSDDPVVPVQPDRNLYQAVKDLGGTQIRYTEYKGVGHNTWDYTPNETTLPKWLLAQKKGTTHNPPPYLNGFTAQLFPPNKVFLEWTVPDEKNQIPDNKVWFCRIYRNNEVISEIYSNRENWIDSAIVAGKSYEYRISVVNYYFRESSLSAGHTVNSKKQAPKL